MLTTAVVKNPVLFKALKIDIFIEWANKSNYTDGHILFFPGYTIPFLYHMWENLILSSYKKQLEN